MNKDHFEVEECLVGLNKTSVMTNGDRIRAMTDEELGRLLFDLGYDAYAYALRPTCKPIAETESGWIDWVKSSAEV